LPISFLIISKKRGKEMKKLGFLALLVGSVLTLSACSGGEPETAESKNYETTNTTVKEATNDDKSTAGVIAEKVLTDHYGLSDAKVDVTSDNFKVTQMPDDVNANDGTIYKNVYSVIGDFDNQGEKQTFDMTYSLKNETGFSVIYFYTPYDESKTINTPLKSEQ